MIGLFTFDAPLYCDKNGVYCNTTITNEMLERYFTVVDKLYLLIRTDHINQTYQERSLKKIDLGRQIEIVELPNPNTPKNFIRSGCYKKIVREYVHKVDLVFIRIPSIYSNIAADECVKLNKPYYAEVGGCAWDSYFNHGISGKVVAPYMFWKQRNSVKQASYVSYVTERWLQNRYPTKGKTIVASNVYLNYFDDENIERRIALYRNKKNKRYKLGTIASVDVRYKGQEFVIRAVAELKKQGILVDYDLVGAGNPAFLHSLAESLCVSEQIHFLGVKLHDDIWAWLDQIDIYAQPSKQEGLPRAVIEAMNRGCLAIGSNVAGIPELLEDDMIFSATDVAGIVSIVKKIISEKDHESRIRRNYLRSRDFEIKKLESKRQTHFKLFQQEVREYGKR